MQLFEKVVKGVAPHKKQLVALVLLYTATSTTLNHVLTGMKSGKESPVVTASVLGVEVLVLGAETWFIYRLKQKGWSGLVIQRDRR